MAAADVESRPANHEQSSQPTTGSQHQLAPFTAEPKTGGLKESIDIGVTKEEFIEAYVRAGTGQLLEDAADRNLSIRLKRFYQFLLWTKDSEVFQEEQIMRVDRRQYSI